MYDDPDLDPSFYGYSNAMVNRKEIAMMTTVQYQKYRQKLKREMNLEYTEETKKAMAAGERLYVKPGIYPPWDDPKDNPNAKYYEYKKEG